MDKKENPKNEVDLNQLLIEMESSDNKIIACLSHLTTLLLNHRAIQGKIITELLNERENNSQYEVNIKYDPTQVTSNEEV